MTLCTGCDQIYGLLDKPGAEEKENLGNLTPFQYNGQVEDVQKLLKLYGYNVGKVDGKFGPATRESIARFQENQGLEITRFVDDATWQELNSFSDSELIVDAEINILAVQEALKLGGFYKGRIDGKFGPQTQKAITKLQQAHQLKVDGIIGLQTLKILKNIKSGEHL